MKERLPYLSHRQQQCMTTVACLGGSRHQQQHLLHLHRRPVVVSHSSSGSSGIMSPNTTSSVEDAKAMMKMHSLPSQSQYETSYPKASFRHQQSNSAESDDGTDQVDSAQSQLERLDLSSKVGNEEAARSVASAEPIPSHPVSPPPSQKTVLDPVQQACPKYNQESPQPPQQIASPCAASRGQFLVFIKILFKVLDQAQEVHTRNRAKKLVAECTRKNRQGDPLYTPLMEAVQKRLRLFVGEAHWRKSMLLLRHYNHQQKQRQAV